MANRKTIRRATRQRVREVLAHELSLDHFKFLITRKSVDLDGKIIVCGTSPLMDWRTVEDEVEKIYNRMTGKR